MRYIIFCCVLFLCGSISAQVNKELETDLEHLNRKYADIKEVTFSYVINIYTDTIGTGLVQSIPMTISKYGVCNHTVYEGMEMLSDTSMMLVIDRAEKKLSLFRQEFSSPKAGAAAMLDTFFLKNVMSSATDVKITKARDYKEYRVSFKDREYRKIVFRISKDHILQYLAVYMEKPEYNSAVETLPPTVMEIRCTGHKASVKDKSIFNIYTYFKLFGNGRYVLNEQYSTYRFINLYESQKR